MSPDRSQFLGFLIFGSCSRRTAETCAITLLLPQTHFLSPRFLIFNLCLERSYDKAYFFGRVEHIETEHRNPPLLDEMVSFVERFALFMEENPTNVVAVHCMTGRGRTGVMVCSWLIYSSFASSAHDAIEWFLKVRC